MVSGEELRVADVMQTKVRTVRSGTSLPDFEQMLLEFGVGGLPVVDEGRLLAGIVSRSDVLKAICSERVMAQTFSDFYRDSAGFHEVKLETFSEIADRVGERIEGLCVKDVMVRKPRTVTAGQLISELAREFVNERIHRLPVVEGADLVGIVTTMDLVKLVALPANARMLRQ